MFLTHTRTEQRISYSIQPSLSAHLLNICYVLHSDNYDMNKSLVLKDPTIMRQWDNHETNDYIIEWQVL